MDSGDRLLGLIERLYAAPGTVDGWNRFLDYLRAAIHGSTAHLISHDRHYDLVRIIGGVIEAGPAAASVLSLARSERQQAFSDAEVTLLSALVPHVQRALQLHRRLVESQRSVDDLAEVVERSSRAVLLLDAAGRITSMTAPASRLLACGDGLGVEHGELWSSNPADRTRLRAAVADAVNTSHGTGLGTGAVMTIGRRSGRQPLIVLVSPVTRQRPQFPGVESAAAIVFVKDPDQIAMPSHETLQTLFELTPAEAKLTRLLAQGCTLQDAGAQLGLRRETARSRLKTIFEKTGTHRQAELVLRVLNASPPM